MKFPSIPHLPWSPQPSRDDKILKTVDHLLGVTLVLTEKMDGSNTCMEREKCFARSHAMPPSHPSFAFFKALHSEKRLLIEPNDQVFGEWLFAEHSIRYENLPAYFMLFGVRNVKTGTWLSWPDLNDYAKNLGFPTVPIVMQACDRSEKDLQRTTDKFGSLPSWFQTIDKKGNKNMREGLVVRIHREFKDEEFESVLAKWVRFGHVQTSEHWSSGKIIRNGLKV